MYAEPICIACDVERKLTDIAPVKNRHDMLSYECPQCLSIFRLVVRRERRELAETNPGRPIFAAAEPA
ncbi:MAG: hypothetical protein E8A46_06690 [Bradyrhizobium sp.]|jgi:hypothetical protein|uniref:hypothetical protein n=1 Tax=Bradyrhizobium sp. TaxID=376 RepID=UPI001227B09F|nr:hypothetical protein [Bradyrhizobium sp.]THD55054.1 MAG: hypothetical protein E8A46_06690 [Bradyrhizobium sp.]